MDLGSALMAVAISLVFKLMVLGFGARLLLRMYRARRSEQPSRMWILLPDEPTAEVRILWWSLVLFYVSELTCGIEIYVLFQSNAYLEGVHGVCSALGMGLFALGAYLVFDERMLRFTSRRCALRGVCRGCTVEHEEGCRFNHLLVLVATLVALAALLPLRVSTEQLDADPSVYILPFESLNAWWDATLVPWLQANIASYSPSGTAYFIPKQSLEISIAAVPAICRCAAQSPQSSGQPFSTPRRGALGFSPSTSKRGSQFHHLRSEQTSPSNSPCASQLRRTTTCPSFSTMRAGTSSSHSGQIERVS